MITDTRPPGRRRSACASFNPSRDDHGPAPWPTSTAGGCRFNPSRDDHGPAPWPTSTAGGCRFNPSRDDHGLERVVGPLIATVARFNPSRDDHGPTDQSSGHAETDSVSIPPGMITDRGRRSRPGSPSRGFNPSMDDHGPGPFRPVRGVYHVSIPPGMITDCRKATCIRLLGASFNPSRDDHGLVGNGVPSGYVHAFQSLQG